MSTSPPPGPGPTWGPGPGGVGRRIEEAVELIEMELRHAVAYVNDAVIPQVQRESISAMRSLSDTLKNLADRIERHQAPRSHPSEKDASWRTPRHHPDDKDQSSETAAKGPQTG